MEKITDLKPRAGSAYSHGWTVMSRNFISLFLVTLIIIAASVPIVVFSNLAGFYEGHSGLVAMAVIFAQIFTIAYSLFILSPLDYGSRLVYLKAARDNNFEVTDMFDSFKNYLNVILASLLSGVIITFGFFFLIIPGIVFACRLAFVPFLVMDKKLDPVKAVEESWRLTRGYGWRIFWMGILAFFIIIGGLIVFIFGVFVSSIWISAAFASLYHAVLLEKDEYVLPNGDAQ